MLPVSGELLAELKVRHAEPHRAYHDWSHIEALLALADEVEADLADPVAVRLAILFHDAVYDPRATDNEARSADLLMRRAPDERARRLVLATADHGLPGGLSRDEEADMRLFLDMDLSILGADAATFARYERGIRAEYAHVPDGAYRAGRAAVLRRFARRDPLFLSAWARARFETTARTNIASSLELLAGDGEREG